MSLYRLLNSILDETRALGLNQLRIDIYDDELRHTTRCVVQTSTRRKSIEWSKYEFYMWTAIDRRIYDQVWQMIYEVVEGGA